MSHDCCIHASCVASTATGKGGVLASHGARNGTEDPPPPHSGCRSAPSMSGAAACAAYPPLWRESRARLRCQLWAASGLVLHWHADCPAVRLDGEQHVVRQRFLVLFSCVASHLCTARTATACCPFCFSCVLFPSPSELWAGFKVLVSNDWRGLVCDQR